MRHYRRNPMPACTWVGESGGSWTARNPVSTAGGRYQILTSTWLAFGGTPNGDRHMAAAAPPAEQEKIARRVLAGQGINAWVLC